MMSGEFKWPCELREAHGPHKGCLGVKAHPLTMIGGKLVSDHVPTQVPEPFNEEEEG